MMCQNLTQRELRATIVGSPRLFASSTLALLVVLALMLATASCTTTEQAGRTAYYSALSTYVDASYAAKGPASDARRLAAHEVASKAVAAYRAGDLKAADAALQLNLATALLFTSPGEPASEDTTNDR